MILCLDLQLCTSYPCMNGGTCFVQRNEAVCFCPTGVSGKNCNISSMMCKIHNNINLRVKYLKALLMNIIFIHEISLQKSIHTKRQGTFIIRKA